MRLKFNIGTVRTDERIYADVNDICNALEALKSHEESHDYTIDLIQTALRGINE